MSVPSTATLHQHQPASVFGYHYSPLDQQNLYYRSSSGAVSNSHVRSNNYPDPLPSPNSVSQLSQSQQQLQKQQQRQQQQKAVMMQASTSQSSRGASSSGKRKKATPDWNDFYRNGLPKEVIVIDDTPEYEEPPARKYAAVGDDSSRIPKALHSASASTARLQPAKRRKGASPRTNDNIYNEPNYASTPYSYTQTPTLVNGSSANTASTSSRVNGTETAATSLASTQGESASLVALTGQKRKRVTRGSMAKKETDAYTAYKPPPHPPYKAKPVYVKQVHDAVPSTTKVDDDDGHFMVNLNTDITARYRIQKLLGQGTFGKVVQAYDKQNKTFCAIKIIRSIQKYRDASQIELRVLSTLGQNDRRNRNKCIHLRDCFDYQNHICIVTDLLGMSVFDFLKANSFIPFPSSQIQSFARQLLTSVAFLHDLNLIHTDLKPENILLVHNSYETFSYNRVIPSSSQTNPRKASARKVLLDTDIRLIDFGSATFDDEYHSSVVSTRHYRAPEIILGLGWSFPCDIWSVGCILVEFFTGDALFQTHDNLEHLAMMRTVCGGDIEPKLVRQALQRGSHSNNGQPNTLASRFFKGYKLDYPNNETTRTSKRYVKAMKALENIIPQTSTFNRQFLNLLQQIFVYDPSRRIRAQEALRHPWFHETCKDEGMEAEKIRREREEDLERRRQRREDGGDSDTEEDPEHEGDENDS